MKGCQLAGLVWGAGRKREITTRAGLAVAQGGGGDEISQEQIPADDQGDKLTDAGIGVAVSATRAADGARELGVGESGEGAGGTGQNERQHDRRAGMLSRDHAGEHEYARADDAADSQHGEVKRAKAAFQTRIGIDVDRFGAEQAHAFSLRVLMIMKSEASIVPEVCLVQDPRA